MTIANLGTTVLDCSTKAFFPSTDSVKERREFGNETTQLLYITFLDFDFGCFSGGISAFLCGYE
ncbi:MAG: hypothetical protein DME69_13110 [Verrucomicrobia bacterium]|nr:MAG: hypothetical protein DME69_13110 [Verrucomicrobiota bacterium]